MSKPEIIKDQAVEVFPYNLGGEYAMHTNTAGYPPQKEPCIEHFLAITGSPVVVKQVPEESSPNTTTD